MTSDPRVVAEIVVRVRSRLVSVPARRSQVVFATGRGLSQRRASTLVKVGRSALRYRSRKAERDAPVLARLSEDLAILSADRCGHARLSFRKMQQDGEFGIDLIAAAPSSAIDAHEVRFAVAALNLIRVVEPAMMEAAEADGAQAIEG